LLVIGSSVDSTNELARQLAGEKGAIFGWHRLTLRQLAAVLARPLLVERNLVPVSGTGAEALVTRVVQELASASALGRYAQIANGPGFAKAIVDVLMELRPPSGGSQLRRSSTLLQSSPTSSNGTKRS
jgi:hypothetical protein